MMYCPSHVIIFILLYFYFCVYYSMQKYPELNFDNDGQAYGNSDESLFHLASIIVP